jgi:signal transduction histidine kinase
MEFPASILNIYLLAVGVTIAAICILGVVVFLNNKKSATSRAFLLLAIITVLYSTANYISYQLSTPDFILWALRITIFFAVWHAFSFFHFSYVFPKESTTYPKFYVWAVIPLVGAVSLLTLTSLVFAGLQTQRQVGMVSQAILGPGIAVFAIAAFGLVIAGLFLLVKKLLRARDLERIQFIFILVGAAVTFLLLITFNLVLPIVFQNVTLIPLAAVFFFPFIAFTTYAIMKYHLLSVKVISAEIFAFLLTITTFSEIIFSQNLEQILFRVGEFILVLIFSLFLIQSVQREVEQREQLADLGRFKSELLSLASHQMRSPLAAMKGFITLIMDGSYGEVSDKVKETLGKVKDSADELIDLINVLLDVRKVEEGRMEYSFEKTDIVPLVNETVAALMPLAQAKNLALASDIGTASVFVNIDRVKFKQVIQNLIDNAIKYTPSGFVKISLKTDGARVLVVVNDSGLGIPASLLPFLFEEFIRDERVKKEIRGTGLGLYIARKIAEAHGGTLTAISPGEGKGSTFTVSIPVMA